MVAVIEIQTSPEDQRSPNNEPSAQTMSGSDSEGVPAVVEVHALPKVQTSPDNEPSTQPVSGNEAMAAGVEVQVSSGKQAANSPSFRELIPIPKVIQKSSVKCRASMLWS